MKRFVLVLVLVAIQHICSPGETLQSLAEEYCPGSRIRKVAEFREGIRELNYDVIGEGDVWVGLELRINSWE